MGFSFVMNFLLGNIKDGLIIDVMKLVGVVKKGGILFVVCVLDYIE